MTMPSIPARKRLQGSPDAGPDALARAASVKWDFTNPEMRKPTLSQTDDIVMPPPPEPWQESAWRGDFEPVERETWRASFADYWQDVKPVVLCAMFVATVLAFVAHRAGLWPS